MVAHDGVIIETSTPTRKGQFTVTVTDNDLLNLKSQFLSYNVYLVKTSDNSKVLTYGGSDYNASGTIHVSTDAFPGPATTYELKTFIEDSYNSSIFNSEAVSAEPVRNGNEALHTVAIYTTGFEGKVTIQGTLENQVSGLTVWADVSSLNLTSPSQVQFVNFNGVYSYIRAKYENKVSGTIDKILLKN